MTRPPTSGSFKRVHQEWSLDNFDDGYVCKGRFKVWMPNHPQAHKNGWIMRARVAYEAYHQTSIPEGMEVHHIDKNTLNDSKENLQLLLGKTHRSISHIRLGMVERVCQHCGATFQILKKRMKDPNRGKYCSLKCANQANGRKRLKPRDQRA